MASVQRLVQLKSSHTIRTLRVWCSGKKLLQEAHMKPDSLGFDSLKTSLARCLVSDSNAMKVLSQSTMLIQDGTNIEELPILIRRVGKDSFPFCSHTYSGDTIREESEFDTSFRQILQNCSSVNEVFKLLEVPTNQVQGYSAAHALQRLHLLKTLNTDWSSIHSFIRSAVMRELYATVEHDVKLLSNDTLISLVECYLAAEGFSPECLSAINIEIQFRLSDCSFTLSELLSLISTLRNRRATIPSSGPPSLNESPVTIVSENSSRFLSNFVDRPIEMEPFDKFSAQDNQEKRNDVKEKSEELLENSWVHLCSRYKELDETTIPATLQILPRDRKNIIFPLEKTFKEIWTRLNPEDVATCLESLIRLRCHSSAIMTCLGYWAYVNVHQMTPPLLVSYITTFLNFNFSNVNLIKVMERCLQLKGSQVPTDILALTVEYCRSCRHVSPIIMDIAAQHFTAYGDSYDPLQMYAVLRAFGQLNYMPADASAFMKKTENCLWNRFDLLEVPHVLEVLASFTFVNILPRNFYTRVTSDDFYSKIKALKNPTRARALMFLKVLKHAVIQGSSSDMESNRNWVLSRSSKSSIYLYQDKQRMVIDTLKDALDDLIGPDYHHFVPFFSCCALYLDKAGLPIQISQSSNGPSQPIGEVAKSNENDLRELPVATERLREIMKLVIILRSWDHYSSNTRTLLGAQAQRLSHLSKLGYLPIEIRAAEFHCNDGVDAIREHLSPHVDFETIEKLGEDQMWKSRNSDDAEGSPHKEDLLHFSNSLTEPETSDGLIPVGESGLLKNISDSDVEPE